MSLIYDTRILDLGAHGLLAITCESGAYPPIPAHRYGYARWYDLQGRMSDVQALCTRRCSRSELIEAIGKKGSRMSHAVASVRGRYEWVRHHASDDYLVASTYAASLGEGLALLIFSEYIATSRIRVVDVPNNRVIYDEEAAQLALELGIQPSSYTLTAEPVLMASGPSCILLSLYMEMVLLQFNGKQWTRLLLPKPSYQCQAISPRWLFLNPHNSNEIEIHARHTNQAFMRCMSSFANRGGLQLSAADGADQCAVAHAGGVVELIDAVGNSLAAIRPMPRIGREDIVAVQMVAGGRYLFAGYGDACVVDVQTGTRAVFDLPDGSVDIDRERFDPAVQYRASYLATANGILTSQAGAETLTPYEALSWQPVMLAKPRVATPTIKPSAKLGALIDRWYKPSLALKPAPADHPWKSQCYGQPHLCDSLHWPHYEGQAMCLLAQIDLEELHASNRQVGTPNPWPNSGGLLFFVAIAADGEIVEDEDFNPIATQTLWVAKLAESPLAAPSGRVSIPPTRIQLLPDHNSVPQVDAAIVEAALLSDEELDVYREFLESHLAESEAQDPSAADMNGDQQFGGYPSPVQSNALEAQAEYIRSEDYPGEDRNGWLRAAQWRLLLQLGSDDVFMWGTDMGRLYFMIHEDDLLRRDFSRVVAFAAGH